ncbi:hypothetical protein MRB53_011450 [Persea americana]|uniref:Uncharacterized protein n=1 Tax=Persea americana TaxID=3435 RepID=A0ACC2LVE0_PERAE|nr:hypothetical protein MRB53_011450 [Persea americana]
MDRILWNPVLLDYTLAEGQDSGPYAFFKRQEQLLFVYAWIIIASVTSLQVRAIGLLGYVLISSFLIRENILALITINIHASLTFVFAAVGLNTIPSMEAIYAIFGTLLLLNSGFFVFLLHILYAVFLTKLGMKSSLTLPKWLEKAV